MNTGKMALVIPCYNEEACIAAVLERLGKLQPEALLVVVNDASADQTAAIVRKCAEDNSRVILLDLPVNLGIGGAVQAGFRYAVRNGCEYGIKIDGDGQHPAESIPRLLEPLYRGEADMVIGSRFLDKNGFQSTWLRRVGIGIFRILNSLLIGQTIVDNTSGFRAYNRAALCFAAENYPSFDYPEPEEVILMARNGFRICEIPVEMLERQGGMSSINPRRAVYYMCKVIFAVLMAALRPSERRKS